VSQRPRSLGELVRSGYRPRTVRREIRDNLVAKLRSKETLFPGVVGYERTVIPGVVNALLAGHDFILLGLRGQAKSRILRALVDFLDPEVPELAGSEVHDDPLAPISTWAQRLLEAAGDDAPVDWLPRASRYNEKLATPDVSIADLLGDIDPIKAATRKLTYADPEVIHFGIVPRTNRGIFAINELPDLAPRIQVGLLNLLEERDLQIRGFPVRLPLDMMFAFSANPEDYTNRGTIITPLKDRIASQILTHYPPSAELAAKITAQEAWIERGDAAIVVPDTVRLLIEEISVAARTSELVDQSSGVSARVAIAAIELLVSNLERRRLATGDAPVHPRVCDLPLLAPAITGKVEMVYEGEQQGAEVVVKKLVGAAVLKTFQRLFPEVAREPTRDGMRELGRDSLGAAPAPSAAAGSKTSLDPYAPILAWFAAGHEVTLSDEMPFAEYERELARVPGLAALAAPRGKTREERAFWAELALEGLHQSVRLARLDLDSTISYKEMLKFQLLKPPRRGPQRSDVH
jgi:magnesium chelatase subunit I